MAFLFYLDCMNYICVNGKILQEDKPALLVANRGYRYGDGLFETIKVWKGNILLQNQHFERLFSGLSLLKFEVPELFSKDRLLKEILELCGKNGCENLARVRLSVFRGNGGLYEEARKPGYVIECWPLDESANRLNENGLVIGIFPDARKSCDRFSNLKSANYQAYSMAALYAKEHKLDDCIVLNTAGNIADSTVANVFLIKKGVITTPALSEGCVAGVMRKYLLEKIPGTGTEVKEKPVTIEELENAEEVFLSNAIYGIRWVKQFRSKNYQSIVTREIFQSLIKTLIK